MVDEGDEERGERERREKDAEKAVGKNVQAAAGERLSSDPREGGTCPSVKVLARQGGVKGKPEEGKSTVQKRKRGRPKKSEASVTKISSYLLRSQNLDIAEGETVLSKSTITKRTPVKGGRESKEDGELSSESGEESETLDDPAQREDFPEDFLDWLEKDQGETNKRKVGEGTGSDQIDKGGGSEEKNAAEVKERVDEGRVTGTNAEEELFGIASQYEVSGDPKQAAQKRVQLEGVHQTPARGVEWEETLEGLREMTQDIKDWVNSRLGNLEAQCKKWEKELAEEAARRKPSTAGQPAIQPPAQTLSQTVGGEGEILLNLRKIGIEMEMIRATTEATRLEMSEGLKSIRFEIEMLKRGVQSGEDSTSPLTQQQELQEPQDRERAGEEAAQEVVVEQRTQQTGGHQESRVPAPSRDPLEGLD